MSYTNDANHSEASSAPSLSLLSADAECFVPSSFGQNVVNDSDAVSSCFNSYMWQRPEITNPNIYPRTIEQWPAVQPYANHGMPHSFQLGHCPMEVDYWPVVYHDGPATQANMLRDGLYSASAGISWNSALFSQAAVDARSRQYGNDLGQHYAAVPELASDFATSSSAVPVEDGIPIRAKKKKRKSRNLIKLEKENHGSVEHVSKGQSSRNEAAVNKDTLNNNNMMMNEGSLICQKYHDNCAQTDFSEELSRLTLAEKPNTLYDQTARQDFLQKCMLSSSSDSSTTDTASAVQSKPALLWTTVVNQKSVQSVGKGPNVDSAVSRTNDLITHPGGSGAGTITQNGSAKVMGHEGKSSFDHSSIRSRSGRRISTGISTSDRPKHETQNDGRQATKTTKNNKAFAVKAAKSGSSDKEKVLSSRVKVGLEKNLDSKDIQPSKEGTKTEKVNANGSDEYVLVKAKGKKSSKLKAGASGDVHNPSASVSEPKSGGSKNLRSAASKSPHKAKPSTPLQPNTRRSVSRGKRASEGLAATETRLVSSGAHDITPKSDISRKGSRVNREDDGQEKSVSSAPSASSAKTHRSKKWKKKSSAKNVGKNEDSNCNNTTSEALKMLEQSAIEPCFDDTDFPGLNRVSEDFTSDITSGPIKYSDILSGRVKTQSVVSSKSKNMKQKDGIPRQNTLTETDGGDDDDDVEDDAHDLDGNEDLSIAKDVPQKPKRSRSQPAKQQQEKKAVGAGKKTKEPIKFNIFDAITTKNRSKASDKKDKEAPDKKPLKTGAKPQKTQESRLGNMLDSSAVQIRRGKERQVPKAKKPSFLRKVILKERESRRQKFLQECTLRSSKETNSHTEENEDDVEGDAAAGEKRHSSAPMRTSAFRLASLSPCSVPTACPPDNALSSESPDSQQKLVQLVIHSRRFREYCNQVLSPEINDCCTKLLQELVRFQDRLYHKDPKKARLKRRLVLGLREVTKHLKVNRIKCVIISPNLERIESKGGLDEALHNIISLCQQHNIPFVFALNRKQLGRACCKVVPVSVAGIFSYEGAEEYFRKLKDLTEKARESYKEMVSDVKADLEEFERTSQLPKDCDEPLADAVNGNRRTLAADSYKEMVSDVKADLEEFEQASQLPKDCDDELVADAVNENRSTVAAVGSAEAVSSSSVVAVTNPASSFASLSSASNSAFNFESRTLNSVSSFELQLDALNRAHGSAEENDCAAIAQGTEALPAVYCIPENDCDYVSISEIYFNVPNELD